MGHPPLETRQQLSFICDMLEQLRTLVPAHAGPLLPKLIDMARLEAAEAILELRQDKSETRPPR